jgi:hypothetical protein
MAAQNDPNNPESSSILHSPSQSESLSSKFLRKSKFLMTSSNCSPSTNDLLPQPWIFWPSSSSANHQPPSEMASPAAESNIKPIITHPPTGVDIVLHTKEKTLQAEKDLQNNNKEAAFSAPLSPVNHSPPSPLMEIIPPPLSHRLQVTTPLESVTAVAPSNTNSTSTQELQSLSEIQHAPCRLYPSWHFPCQNSNLTPWSIVTESQIDDAKSLVLDLLGWGVDPEYLVTSGVHPELIYRIFTDLNLRLPINLVFRR